MSKADNSFFCLQEECEISDLVYDDSIFGYQVWADNDVGQV